MLETLNTCLLRAACIFPGTGVLATYWMGLTNTSSGWLWPDGTAPNNFVSDDEPYGHWGPDFYATWAASNCISGNPTKGYIRC